MFIDVKYYFLQQLFKNFNETMFVMICYYVNSNKKIREFFTFVLYFFNSIIPYQLKKSSAAYKVLINDITTKNWLENSA